jgi:DNA-binding IclR family transcriptional regulator
VGAALEVDLGQTASPAAARTLQLQLRAPALAGGKWSTRRGERAVLVAVAQHAGGVTRDQLSVLAGYKRSSRDTFLQHLRAAGLVEDDGGRLVATDLGIEALGPDFEPLPTGAALRDYWLARLPEGERKLLALLVEVHPDAVERAALDSAGYQRSSRDTYLQRLTARRLVEVVGRGSVRAAAALF